MLKTIKGRRYLVGALILAVLVMGALGLHKKRIKEVEQADTEQEAPWALHVEKVTREAVTRGFPVLATVMTREELTIMPRISGRIFKMGPREGVRVKKGTLLVRIDTREIEDKIKSLKAQLKSAEAEKIRMQDEQVREEKLFKEGGSSESALEERRTAALSARQKVRSLKHDISMLNVQKGYGVIRSPAGGVVAERFAEPGNMADPGHPIYRITVSQGARVRVQVPQSVLHEMHQGTPLILYHDRQELPLEVDRVFPSVDAKALGIAEADLDQLPFGLPSGARVNCRVILEQIKTPLRVPYDSLLCFQDQNHCRVFKVKNRNGKSEVEVIPVIVKLRGRNGVAVEGDLAPGDEVIIAHENVLLKIKSGQVVMTVKGELQ